MVPGGAWSGSGKDIIWIASEMALETLSLLLAVFSFPISGFKILMLNMSYSFTLSQFDDKMAIASEP